MKNFNITRVILLIIINLLVFGCNSQPDADKYQQSINNKIQFTDDENNALNAIASDKFLEFLGKTFDKKVADEKYEREKNNQGEYINPDYDESVESMLLVTNLLLGENLYNRLLHSDAFKFNLDSIIADGLMAIVPRNPYSGNDIKTSLEYSPGDCLFAADQRGVAFIYHAGNKEDSFEPSRKDHSVLTYRRKFSTPDVYSDGRSLIHYHKFTTDEYSQLIADSNKMRIDQYGENYSNDVIKIYWIYRQVRQMIVIYSFINENVPQSLEDYINYFGRINPPAWINPYTGQPMKQVGFAQECEYQMDLDQLDIDIPVLPEYLDKQKDKSLYAGNYSFATYQDKDGPVTVFAIYYIKLDGNLAAIDCRVVPESVK